MHTSKWNWMHQLNPISIADFDTWEKYCNQSVKRSVLNNFCSFKVQWSQVYSKWIKNASVPTADMPVMCFDKPLHTIKRSQFTARTTKKWQFVNKISCRNQKRIKYHSDLIIWWRQHSLTVEQLADWSKQYHQCWSVAANVINRRQRDTLYWYRAGYYWS